MAFVKVLFFRTLIIFCVFYYVNTQNNVVKLHEQNWHQILQDEWMVEFMLGCGCRVMHHGVLHAKVLQSIWKEFATLGTELSIKIGQVDVTVSPGVSGRFMVTTLPTIFHVFNGEFRQYKGKRDKHSFVLFITEKRWKVIDPIPRWKSPNSIQMWIISSFFKLSQVLRGIHNYLMEEFGLPTWGSYLVFTVVTMVVGAILGLIVVFFIELIFPLKTTTTTTKVKDKVMKKEEKLSDDELSDETITDDVTSKGDQLKSKQSVEGSSGGRPSSPNVKKRRPQTAD